MDPVNQTAGKTSVSLPSIGQLFQESWHTFTQSLLSLFILNVLLIAIYIGLAVVAFLVFILSGAGSFLLKNGLQGLTTALPNIPSSTIVTLVVIGVVFGLICSIIVLALQISSILLVDSQGKASLGSAFKKSLGLIIPLFLVGILTSVLTFGAFFVFILPAILFYFLLIFVQFEVILNNQRWLGAVRRSVLVVSKNFGAIIIRLIIIVLIYIGIAIIIPNLLYKIGPETKIFVGIISFLINLLLGWYMLAYDITLYKQARIGLEQESGKGIVWMWVIAVLGWLIAAGVFFVGYKAISSGALNQVFKKSSPTTSSQQKESLSSPFIKAGQTKLATANQLATKANLSDEDRSQIRGLINGALADFNTAVEKDSENYQAWYYRGLAYRNLMGVAENADKFAIESYQKAIALNPSDYNAYLELGGVYYQLKDYEKAIENFQKVTELQPKSANGYFNLGVAYKQVGAKDSARKALQKALELLPKEDPTRYKAESELNSL